MRTIWKYPLAFVQRLPYIDPAVPPENAGECTVALPVGAIIRHIDVQDREPALWAEVDTDEVATEDAHFVIYGTGWSLPESPGTYVATYQAPGWMGTMVWHIYRRY